MVWYKSGSKDFWPRRSLRGFDESRAAIDECQKSRSAESLVKEIRLHTKRKFTAEEKIRIVLEGLKGEASIAELCRREGIGSNLYYHWSKGFLEAGKKRLQGDTVRKATSSESVDRK